MSSWIKTVNATMIFCGSLAKKISHDKANDMRFEIIVWYSRDLAAYQCSEKSENEGSSNETCEKRLDCCDAL